MIKICFITNNINQYGGIERVYARLAQVFTQQNKYAVHILSLYTKESHPFFSLPEEVAVTNAGLSFGDSISAYIADFLKKNNDITHVMTFHPTIGLGFSRVNRKNVIWIATEHGSPLDYTFKRRLANLYTYSKADKLVLLTEAYAQYYRKRGIKNVSVIPNPVSFQSEKVSPLTSKTIVSVGRLEQVKRFDLLLRAFAIVHSQHPDYVLKIVGGGSLENELKSLADELGIASSVEFMGIRNDVQDILMDAKIMVISSEYEGFSLVALEAMECGLPIAAFELPPLLEMNDGSDIFSFVPFGDYVGLADKINNLIENPELLRVSGENAKKRAADYSLSAIGSKWNDLIENCEYKELTAEKCGRTISGQTDRQTDRQTDGCRCACL
jgi:glycosyltransferase involved in cell wall biosynthesis